MTNCCFIRFFLVREMHRWADVRGQMSKRGRCPGGRMSGGGRMFYLRQNTLKEGSSRNSRKSLTHSLSQKLSKNVMCFLPWLSFLIYARTWLIKAGGKKGDILDHSVECGWLHRQWHSCPSNAKHSASTATVCQYYAPAADKPTAGRQPHIWLGVRTNPPGHNPPRS